MNANELNSLPLAKVQGLYAAYGLIIECIEIVAGSPYNVGANGEYWSAIKRRNLCRQVYSERLAKGERYEDGK